MKTSLLTRFCFWQLALLLVGSATVFAATNVPPTPVVLGAVQRSGTTFMDIDYRVDDPDDATVQTAALGFVDGGTTNLSNLSSVLKLTTLVEGTAANIGTNIPANTPKRLTWNVAADWNTNFGNVQVEILAKDGRGLLPFHWITLPSNGPNPELTVNSTPIYDRDLLPLWYWLIANGDPAIQLIGGKIYGAAGSYSSLLLAEGEATKPLGREYLREALNLRSLSGGELVRAKSGRYGLQAVDDYSVARGFIPTDRTFAWGNNGFGQAVPPLYRRGVTAVAVGQSHSLQLSPGFVDGWGANVYGETTLPAGLSNVTAIAAGSYYSLALKSDGTVVGWGYNYAGQTTVPAGLSNATAIAAGYAHSLALKSDGTVVGWGYNMNGETTVPAGLSNATAIAAGGSHSLALKSDGTVEGWGHWMGTPPAGLSNVTAIAAGDSHSLALKSDGTVVAWGYNSYGQANVPNGLSNVTAIAAGRLHSLALKSDGTVVVWGDNTYGQTTVPAGLTGIDLIATGCTADHVLVVDKRTP
jgi:hypothetical protein